MRKANDKLPLLSFGLVVKIREPHYDFSDLIPTEEEGINCTRGNESVALAARSHLIRIQEELENFYRIPATRAITEALQSVGIPHEEIFVIINSEKGTYFRFTEVFNNKDWVFQANYPYPNRLLTALKNRQNCTFTINFCAVECYDTELVPPAKPLWQSMIIDFAKLAGALLAIEGLFMALGSKVSLEEIRNTLLYALAFSLTAPLLIPICADRSLYENLYKFLQKWVRRFEKKIH